MVLYDGDWFLYGRASCFGGIAEVAMIEREPEQWVGKHAVRFQHPFGGTSCLTVRRDRADLPGPLGRSQLSVTEEWLWQSIHRPQLGIWVFELMNYYLPHSATTVHSPSADNTV
jgi:hypothetical protein